MKKNFLVIVFILTTYIKAGAQNTTKEYTVGHQFRITLADYMFRTTGMNASAALQFKNDEKDIFGFVIQDTKEDLNFIGLTFAKIDSFYHFFIDDFIKDADKRNVSKATSTKKGDINFIEADFSYLDAETKVEIYYMIGIVETKDCYYKVLCCCSLANKDKFKSDFQKVLYSLTD